MPFLVSWIESFKKTEKKTVETPVGFLELTVSEDVIIGTHWILSACVDAPRHRYWQDLFDSYWQDQNRTIEVKLLIQGTPYRRRVWDELCRIPLGETRTYAALAKMLGSSARAVGNACRDNPYAPIIPCHRVVSTAGIGGYCGQTEGDLLDIKKKLLRIES